MQTTNTSLNSLLQELLDQKVELRLEQGNLKLRYSGKLDPQLVARIKSNKAALVAYLSKYNEQSRYSAIEPLPRQVDYALSFEQTQMWFTAQLEKEVSSHNIYGVNHCKFAFNIAAATQAMQHLVHKYQILRTTFSLNQNHEPRQVVLPTEQAAASIEHLTHLAHDQDQVYKAVTQRILHKFNLATAPLFKVTIIDLPNNECLFMFVLSHLVADGASVNIFLNQFLTFYTAAVQGQSTPPQPLAVQYKDYAHWQAQMLQNQSQQSHKAFWQQQLKAPLSNIALGHSQAAGVQGSSITRHIDLPVAQQIEQLLAPQRATLFMKFTAFVYTFLYHYTGVTDHLVGTPVSGRNHPDLEPQIGYFINSLPLRQQVQPHMPFSTLLEQVQQTVLQAFEHQHYPYLKMKQDVDAGHHDLFNVMVSLHNYTGAAKNTPEHESNNLVGPYDRLDKSLTSTYPLTFNIHQEPHGINIDLVYQTGRFTSHDMERLFNNFETLLHSILAQPHAPIEQLQALAPAQQQQLLNWSKGPQLPAPQGTVVQLIEQQAASQPQALAVHAPDQTLTFDQLNSQANQLAHYLLQQHTLAPNSVVALQLPRSAALPVCVLAVLKAGAAYLPIDPEHPLERVNYIKQNSQCAAFIDQDRYQQFLAQQQQYSTQNPQNHAQPQHLAYVIYTSGSTGRPKGVMVQHNNLSNWLAHYALEQGRTAMTCSYVFDVSVMELFATLTSGSTLYVPPAATVLDPTLYATYLHQHQITHCYLHPMHIAHIGAALEKQAQCHLKRILVGVEAIKGHDLAWFLAQNIKVLNGYGPTECTIAATMYTVQQEDTATASYLPIGRPIGNYQVYIVNPHGHSLQPIGQPGEICIAGQGVARAYLNSPELTAQKFVPNPFAPSTTMYRTGDLARWLPNGNIQFIGRADSQLKIRGHRIEPAEIQTALQAHPAISQCAVLAMPTGTQAANGVAAAPVLVAYYLATKQLQATQLRQHLLASLPLYMVPTHFVQLPQLPMTANGKLDKQALPTPQTGAASQQARTAPQTAVQQTLATQWAQLLEVPPSAIGLESNFFELGGHSLLVLKLAGGIHQALQVQLTVPQLFEAPQLQQQAQLIEQQQSTTYQAIPQAPQASSYPLSSSQKRIWVLSQFQQASAAYHITTTMPWQGQWQPKALQQSLDHLVQRHPALRTVFKPHPQQGPRQVVLPKATVPYTLLELPPQQRVQQPKEQLAQQQAIAQFTAQPFNLEKGPLCRWAMAQTGPQQYVLVLVLHHIVADGESIQILRRELAQLYQHYAHQKPLSLPPLTVQYTDFAMWQQAQLQEGQLTATAQWWQEQFKNPVPILNLPTNRPRPAVKTFAGSALRAQIPAATYQPFKQLAQQQQAQPFMAALALTHTFLHLYSGQNNIVVGSPAAGRPHPSLQEQVGCYVNTLAFNMLIDPQKGFETLLNQVRSTTIQAYEHQAYPFDELVNALQLPTPCLMLCLLFSMAMQAALKPLKAKRLP